MKQKERLTVIARAAAMILVSGSMLFNYGTCSEKSTTTEPIQTASSHLVSTLVNTQWRLIEFRSMDDAIGIKRTDDSSKYTMRLNGDGTVTLQLNCNSANGTWSTEAGQDLSNGRFEFGSPFMATRVLCPPPSMDELVLSQAPYVRSFLLKDGRLYLSLMADGGIFVWKPDN